MSLNSRQSWSPNQTGPPSQRKPVAIRSTAALNSEVALEPRVEDAQRRVGIPRGRARASGPRAGAGTASHALHPRPGPTDAGTGTRWITAAAPWIAWTPRERMSPRRRIAVVTGGGQRHRRGRRAGAGRRRLDRRAGRPPARGARRGRRAGAPGCPAPSTRARPTSPTRPRSGRCSTAPSQRHGRVDLLFNNAGIGAPARDLDDVPLARVERGGRGEPHRRVPLHPGGVPGDAQPAAAGRPDHQQRLDLRARAAAAVDRLHRDQARDHRADEVDLARRPRRTTSPAGRSTSATRRPR